ncbi:MAG TPA: hypothetical protein VJH89_02485 [Patescibacteria group bacterium]|nr:hypothetical protein [Patescibacteria group bacterium]
MHHHTTRTRSTVKLETFQNVPINGHFILWSTVEATLTSQQIAPIIVYKKISETAGRYCQNPNITDRHLAPDVSILRISISDE